MSESTTTGAMGGADWESLARGAANEFGNDLEGTVQVLRELLVFGLDGAAYAVPVERVREIVRMRELTTIPRAPGWLLGVVALRGEVVEVVDLRRRLGLGASTPDRSNRIIVLHGDADRVTGLLVDSVSEVYRIIDDEVLPAQGLDVTSVSEVCPRGEEFVSILDVERVLGVSDG
jgi:purine-binding chemotaxis protein CheW